VTHGGHQLPRVKSSERWCLWHNVCEIIEVSQVFYSCGLHLTDKVVVADDAGE
jgi:hypothetical protein